MEIQQEAATDNSPTLVPWAALDVCVRGAPLLKFGRQGEPHFRDFQLSSDCRQLAWASQKKADDESRVTLRGCTLSEGQQTDVFRRQPRPDLEDLCFSLIYEDPLRRGQVRTLDVACKDRREYEAWVAALAFLCAASPPEGLLRARRASLWSDIQPIGGGGQAGGAKSSSRITQALKKRIKDTNDVYVWGRSSWGELGLGDEAARPEPTLVNVLLGKAVRLVACGASHCIALCDSGEAFAWGNGGCGRLGTGGVDHELSPRLLLRAAPGAATGKRVRTIDREPFRFRTAACGDMHSLAVGLEDGRVYAWGAGLAGAVGSARRENLLEPTALPAFIAICEPQRISEAAAAADAAADADGWGTAASSSAATAGPAPRPGGQLGMLQSLAAAPLEATAAQSSAFPPRFALCTPHVVAVGAGSSYSAFVDNRGRLFTCGTMDAPLGHDVAQLSRLVASAEQAKAALAAALAAASASSAKASASASAASNSAVAVGAPASSAIGSARAQVPSGGIIAPSRPAILSLSSIASSVGSVGESRDLSGSLLATAALSPTATVSALGIAADADSNSTPSPASSRGAAPMRPGANTFTSTAAAAALASAAADAMASNAAAASMGLVAVPTSLLLCDAGLRSRGGVPTENEADELLSLAESCLISFTGGGATTAASDLLMPLQVIVGAGGGSSGASSAQVLSMGCGDLHMCVATSGGQAYSWGWGGSGALGHGDTLDRTVPARITSLPRDIVQVACGAAHTLVIVDKPAQMPPPPSTQAPQPVPLALASATPHSAQVPVPTTALASAEVSSPAPLAQRDGAAVATRLSQGFAGEVHAALRELYAFGSSAFGQVPRNFSDAVSAAAEKPVAQAGAPKVETICPFPRLVELVPVRRENQGSVGPRPALASAVSRAGPAPAPGQVSSPAVPGLASAAAAASAPEPQASVSQRAVPRTIAAGGFHSAVVTTDDVLYVCGSGSRGELGLTNASALELARILQPSIHAPSKPRRRGSLGVFSPVSSPTGLASASDAHLFTGIATKMRSMRLTPGRGGAPGASEQRKALDDGSSASAGSTKGAADAAALVDTTSSSDRPFSPQQQAGLRPFQQAHAGTADAAPLSDDLRPRSLLLSTSRVAELSLLSRDDDNGFGSSDEDQAPTGTESVRARTKQRAEAASLLSLQMERQLDIKRPASPTRVREYMFGMDSARAPSGPQLPPPAPSKGGAAPAAAVSVPAQGVAAPLASPAAQASTPGPLLMSAAAAAAATTLSAAPVASTIDFGFLPVPGLLSRDVKSCSCGNGFTVALVSTQWMRNEESMACNRCGRAFTLLLRRHHCRRCGVLFCGDCSSLRLPLLALGYIEPVRVCDGCVGRVLLG